MRRSLSLILSVLTTGAFLGGAAVVYGNEAEQQNPPTLPPAPDAQEGEQPNPPDLPPIPLTDAKPLSPQAVKLKQILDSWDNRVDQWKLAYSKADAMEKAHLWETRPNGAQTVKDIWNLIRLDINAPWVIPGIAWFLRNPDELANFPGSNPSKIMEALLNAVEFHLVEYPEVKDLCPYLAITKHLRAMSILEKIYNTNKDKVTKGYAALGIAIRLRMSGSSEDEDSAKVRVGHIMFALKNIEGFDFGRNFGNQKVSEVVREEMYRLNNLTLSKKPPHIKATTLDGKVFDTEAMAGNVIAALFWNPADSSSGVLQPFDKMCQRLASKGLKGVVIAPVPPEELKELVKKQGISTPVISDESGIFHMEYRVARESMGVVIDKNGLLHFREAIYSLIVMMPLAEQLMAEKVSTRTPDNSLRTPPPRVGATEQ